MSRTQALLVITLLWAAIFLPALGSTEIKGEEGRRIMPATEILEGGDWLVPHFNGRPYLRKPPLVNWLIALAFKTFGARNEWTARLPSVLSVLAMALVILGVGISWLGVEAALVAAIFTLVNAGMLEKGRLAEIEALYISLYGIAITCWLSFWAQKKSPWLLWMVPAIFLGLGLLAKAPLHLLFFYALVVPVLVREKRARELLHPAHLASVVLMIAIFAAWAVPFLYATAHLKAADVWANQMRERLGGSGFHLGSYLANIPRGLCNYLPWLLLLPLLWSRAALEKLSERDAEIIRATRWPLVLCFSGLLFIPGMLPRYTLPMIVPASLLLAMVLQGKFGAAKPLRWSLSAGGIAALGIWIFALAIVPRMNAQAEVRDFAQKVNDGVAPDRTLYIFDPGIFPPAFYIRSHIVYSYSTRDLPDAVDFILVRGQTLGAFRKEWRDVRVLAELADKSKNKFFLLQLRGKL